MYKIIAIVLSTLLIAAFQIQAASAGCGGGHGGFRAYPSHAQSHAAQQSRARKAQLAAARQKKAAQVARAEKAAVKKADEPKTASATFTEKKTEAASTEVSDEKVTVAAVAGSCTKFIAATGTTATVECTKE
jgi:hypothetical protein